MENKQKKGSPVFLSKVVDIQLKVHLIWGTNEYSPYTNISMAVSPHQPALTASLG